MSEKAGTMSIYSREDLQAELVKACKTGDGKEAFALLRGVFSVCALGFMCVSSH